MSEDVFDHFADQIEYTLGGHGEVMIYVGQLAVHAVTFSRLPGHDRLAWVQDKDGEGLTIDMGAIYAVKDVIEPIPPSTWLPT